jgi:monoterpene epsilon-lactone hydrolase
MSQEQRDAVDQMMRHAPLDLGGDVPEQRDNFEKMIAAIPLADDVVTTTGALGGVPVVNVEVAGAETGDVVFYLHGGAYAIGSAAASAGLASDVVRRAGARAISVGYRLAPESPYPAAVDDAVAAYRALLETVPSSRITVVGESAGGGLAVATLVALKLAGLPQPSSAVVFSPWADLTLSGDSVRTKAAVDPSLTPAGLRLRAADYAAGKLADPLASPVFADLAGLPPLLIQVGSHEILLDDATRLAARAAAADVPVTMEVTPGVPHVFQAFSALLGEADDALNSAGAFIRAHLAAGESA